MYVIERIKIMFSFCSKFKAIKTCFCTLLLKPLLRAYGEGLVANSFSHISSLANVSVGNHVNFNGMTITGKGSVEIGNFFHSGTNVKIMLGSHDYENGDKIPYGKNFTEKKVIIDDFVWIGSDVIISGNVHIAEGAVIAIGSVVVKDVPRGGVVGGNPAQILKYRNMQHFEELKNKNKFN